MCGIIFLGGSGKAPSSKAPSSSGADCQAVASARLYVNLPLASNISTYRNSNFGCNFFPAIGSNPILDFGATSPYVDKDSKYYLQINVRAACGYSKQYIWTGPAGFLNIEVPSQVPYTVVVDYQERCTGCNPAPSGRTQLGFTQDFGAPLSTINANLQYRGYVNCQ